MLIEDIHKPSHKHRHFSHTSHINSLSLHDQLLETASLRFAPLSEVPVVPLIIGGP